MPAPTAEKPGRMSEAAMCEGASLLIFSDLKNKGKPVVSFDSLPTFRLHGRFPPEKRTDGQDVEKMSKAKHFRREADL